MAKKEAINLKEKYRTEKLQKKNAFEMIKHIICLVLPVIFAFLGYFLSPYMWILLNKDGTATELFRFVCSVIFFLIPTVVIFIETRTLNPIINIVIRDK